MAADRKRLSSESMTFKTTPLPRLPQQRDGHEVEAEESLVNTDDNQSDIDLELHFEPVDDIVKDFPKIRKFNLKTFYKHCFDP